MPVYTVQAPDGRKIKVEAASPDIAIQGAQEWAAANPAGGKKANSLGGVMPSMLSISPPGEVSQSSPAYDEALASASARSRALGSPQGVLSPQENYQAALDKIRRENFAPMSDAEWQKFVDSKKPYNAGDLLNSGLTFGFNDELAGAANALKGVLDGSKDPGRIYQNFSMLEKARQELGSEQAGGMGVAAEVAGNLLSSRPDLAAGKVTGLLPAMWDAAKGGAATGAIAGAGQSNGGINERLADAFRGGVAGGLVGGAVPAAFAGASKAAGYVGDSLFRPIATMANRQNEATRVLGRAAQMDQATGNVMPPAMEQLAQQANAPVTNADRFGTAIRTLARTSSNVTPDAKSAFKELTEQRFYTQGQRAEAFVKKLMNGATDDLRLQDKLLAAARVANKTAYDAAYSAPKAGVVWTPRIQQLMQAPEIQAAIRQADTAAQTDAALLGVKPVKNPFIVNPDGTIANGFRKQADGSTAKPSLQFWDIVQRELRIAKEALSPNARTAISRYEQLRRELLNELDGAVPQFQQAREGAAAFFGAENAIEAGRKAFNSPKAVPEIQRAVGKATKAEQEAMAVGYSSEMIDAIRASRDRVNVINSIFGSESMRARNIAIMGKQRAAELEAFVKMEQVLDELRLATQGNSTTAQQLIAAGVIGGGGGFLLSGGDVTQGATWAFLAAVGRRGLQMIGKRVDDDVMRIVAEALVSQDPTKMQRAIQNASISQKHMQAIDGIMRGLSLATRGALAPAAGAGAAAN